VVAQRHLDQNQPGKTPTKTVAASARIRSRTMPCSDGSSPIHTGSLAYLLSSHPGRPPRKVASVSTGEATGKRGDCISRGGARRGALGRRTPAPLSRSILDEGGEHAGFALGQLGSDRLERASVEALEVEHSEQHDDEQHQREEHEEAAVRQRRGVGRHAVGEEAADRVLAQLCRLNDFRAQEPHANRLGPGRPPPCQASP
jgi:hypothetical protein